ITINKVTVNKTTKETTVVPISVNVGKYYMESTGWFSAKTEDTIPVASQIANISGAGTFAATNDVVVTGKVNVGVLEFFGNTVTLEGTKSSFTGSVYVNYNAYDVGTLAYDKANAKNVKFGDVDGVGFLALTVKINGEIAEGEAIAAITGDYTSGKIKIKDSELIVARSDKNLVAVSEESVIPVKEYAYGSVGFKATRLYDTLENAMKDINRLNNKNSNYLVIVANAADKTYSKLPLPSAGKYNSIAIDGNSNTIINVTSDITLTGDCYIDGNVTINKVDKNGKVVEMSVNVGNYDFHCGGKLSYDTTKSVNQLKNVSGKGTFQVEGDATVSGKVNVGTFVFSDTITLGEKAAFAGNIMLGVGAKTLKYPVAVGKNVKLGTIIDGYASGNPPGTLYVQIDGVKAGDQIAALTGDYIAGTVIINSGSEFTAVRSGTKLVAVAKGTEVTVSDGTKTRAYDTYENAVADITRLANADGEYTIRLPEGKYEWAKPSLPAKGKYKSVTLVSLGDGAEISVKSDITLTGDLVIGDGVTLQKVKTFGGDPVSPFKFTSAKNKDGSPVYTVTVLEGGKIVNGTLNGKEIENPAEPTIYTVGQDFGEGVEAIADIGLLFNKTNVEEGGRIVVTFKNPVSGEFFLVTTDESPKMIASDCLNEESTMVIFILDSNAAEYITANSFYFGGSVDSIVTSVKYKAPTTYTVGQDLGDGVELRAGDAMIFNKTNVAEGGKIVVTFKNPVSGDFLLVTTDESPKELARDYLETEGTKAEFMLESDDVNSIIANGFCFGGDANSIVTSVIYEAPSKYTVGQNFGNGVAIGDGMTFNGKTVAEGGKIVVTFKDNVTGTFKLIKNENAEELASVTLAEAANKAEFTIAGDCVSYIINYGFILAETDGGVLTTSEAVVKTVTYEEPAAPTEPEVTNVSTLPWSGSVVFGADGGKDLVVAKELIAKDNELGTIIYVTFEALSSDSGSIVLKNSGGTVIETKPISNEVVTTVQFQITAAQAAELFTNGFTITAANVTLTNVRSELNSVGDGGSEDVID
ncbi:MAG: hypothetical protein ACI4J6_01270, partial [Oscillospiraceae bacterium]